MGTRDHKSCVEVLPLQLHILMVLLKLRCSVEFCLWSLICGSVIWNVNCTNKKTCFIWDWMSIVYIFYLHIRISPTILLYYNKKTNMRGREWKTEFKKDRWRNDTNDQSSLCYLSRFSRKYISHCLSWLHIFFP